MLLYTVFYFFSLVILRILRMPTAGGEHVVLSDGNDFGDSQTCV